MTRKQVISMVMASAMCFGVVAQPVFAAEEPTFLTYTEEEIFNKVAGGWIGEMAGVAWAAPTEFYNFGKYFEDRMHPDFFIIPEEYVPEWTPETINDSFDQDDLFVDCTFLNTLADKGPYANWKQFGEYFRDSEYWLAHANKVGRNNLRAGIESPWSGHYSNTLHAYDIDWQIECDAVAMACIGMPEVAKDIAFRAGHVMNYGDGVYGGVFVSTMYAAAYTANSVREIIEAGMNAIPQDSTFWQLQNDVLANYDAGMSWEDNRTYLQEEWYVDRCPSASAWFDIDAKFNSGMILIGLLYGEGDFEKTMEISMRCGGDSDCNPASAAGILGCYYGLDAIDDKWKSAADWDNTEFQYTGYTLRQAVEANMEVAKSIIIAMGGSVENGVWNIPVMEDQGAIILEQWPKDTNAAPEFDYVVSANGSDLTVYFDALATDDDDILEYEWFFGDLTHEKGASAEHTYREAGTYKVTCYVSDGRGNTSWKQIDVLVR